MIHQHLLRHTVERALAVYKGPAEDAKEINAGQDGDKEIPIPAGALQNEASQERGRGTCEVSHQSAHRPRKFHYYSKSLPR